MNDLLDAAVPLSLAARVAEESNDNASAAFRKSARWFSRSNEPVTDEECRRRPGKQPVALRLRTRVAAWLLPLPGSEPGRKIERPPIKGGGANGFSLTPCLAIAGRREL